MKRSIGAIIALLAAGSMLAACNNNNNSNVVPTPGPNCGGPPNSMEVLYPIPGSRHIPGNVGGVYVATKGALVSGNQYDFLAVQSNGSQQITVNQSGQPISSPGSGFFTINPSTIPSPHRSPSFANPTYYATAFINLIGPSQGVDLLWADQGRTCNPNVIVSSFKTQ